MNQAAGLEGQKGVLWWEILRVPIATRPRSSLLENVDRLLKSPASQRGRDFAIILWCLSDLGYLVEWRVVNASDYGFPQRRRRVLIVANETVRGSSRGPAGPIPWLYRDGVLAQGAVRRPETRAVSGDRPFRRPVHHARCHPALITQEFGWSNAQTPFLNAGVMWRRDVWTRSVTSSYEGPSRRSATCSRTLRRTGVVLRARRAARDLGVPEGTEA